MECDINDIVILKSNCHNTILSIGALGTIIEILSTHPLGVYEVEFIDKAGRQIACLTLNDNQMSKRKI